MFRMVNGSCFVGVLFLFCILTYRKYFVKYYFKKTFYTIFKNLKESRFLGFGFLFFCLVKKIFFGHIFSKTAIFVKVRKLRSFFIFLCRNFYLVLHVFFLNTPLDKIKNGVYNWKSNWGWFSDSTFFLLRIPKIRQIFGKNISPNTGWKSGFNSPARRQSNPEVWVASKAGVRTLGKFCKKSAMLNFCKIYLLGVPKPH